MANPKIRKKKKKNLIFRFALLVFAVSISVQLISLQVDIAQKKRDRETLEQKIAAQTISNEDLQKLLDSGMNPEYVEKIAREQWGYVAPNERVFVDVAGQ